MVYNKYTKKNGRQYGPYLYENKRVGEKVVTSYLGKSEGNSWKKFAIYSALVLVLIFLALFVAYNLNSPTGRVTLGIETKYVEGEPLQGSLKFNIRAGELVPKESKILVSIGENYYEFPLSQFTDAQTINGQFFAEDTALSGEGEGYGKIGSKVSYPEVSFDLKVFDTEKETPTTPPEETPTEEIPAETPTTPTEETPADTTIPTEEMPADTTTPTESAPAESASSDAPSAPAGTGEATASSDSGSSSGDSGSSGGESGGSSGITGNVISEEMPTEEITTTETQTSSSGQTVSGTANKNSDFSYLLGDGKDAELVPGSVEADGKSISDDNVNVKVSRGTVKVSTDYELKEEGYGDIYLGKKALTLDIDLSKLVIPAENGTLIVQLDYNGTIIAASSATVKTVPGEIVKNETIEVNETVANVTEINETIANLTVMQIGNIPSIRIAKDSSANVDLSDYFSGAESYEFDVANITESFNGNILTLTPDENFSGARKGRVNAIAGVESIESNEFTILVSSGGVKITTSREQIKVGEPVRWTKDITLENNESISVVIPGDAENVTVLAVNDNVAEEINAEVALVSGNSISGMVTAELDISKKPKFFVWLSNLYKSIAKGLTGRVIDDLNETGNDSEIVMDKSVTLEGDANEYVIEYYTPAAESIELNTSEGKIVTVSAPEGLGYTDVIASTSIDSSFAIVDPAVIKVYWENTEKAGEIVKTVDSIPEFETVEDVNSSDTVALNETQTTEDATVNNTDNNQATNNITSDNAMAKENVSQMSLTGSVVSDISGDAITENENITINNTLNETISNETINDGNGTTIISNAIVSTTDAYTLQEVPFDAYDLDGDGVYDYIEWVVPHFSNQTYQIILTSTNVTTTVGNVTLDGDYYHLSPDTTQAPYTNLVAYYSFDGDNSSTAFDSSSNNNDGTYTNGAYVSGGCIYDDCATFDGTDDVINLGTNKVYSQNANYSVSAWIKGSSQVTRVIYSEGNSAVDTQFFQLSTSATGTGIRFLVRNNSGQNIINDATTKVSLDSTWHHVTLTDNAGVYKIYIDGVQNASGTYTTYPVTLNKVTIGALGGTVYSGYFNGSIDEVMIFNASLSDAQISAIYNNQSARFKGSGEVYAKPISLDLPKETIDLSLADYERVQSTNMTVNIGEWDISRGYNTTDMNASLNGLIAYYNFDNLASLGENTTKVVDRTGRYNLSIWGPGSYNTSGVYGGSYSFPGSAVYSPVAGMSTNPVLRFNYTQATISTWVKFNTNLSNRAGIIGSGYYSTDNFMLQQHHTANTIFLTTGYSNTSNIVLNINTTKWYHLVVVFDSTQANMADRVKWYVDGQSYSSSTSGVAQYSNFSSKGGVSVGFADSTFNGSIDELMLFNRSLNANEVSELYVKGRALWSYSASQNLTDSPSDYSVYTQSSGIVACYLDSQVDSCTGIRNGTLTNGATWNTNTGLASRNLTGVFDGSNDMVNVSNYSAFNITGNITVSAWIKPNYFTDGAPIVGRGLANPDGGNGRAWGMGYNSNAIFRSVTLDIYNGTTWCGVFTTTVVPLNQWSHVLGLFNGQRLQMYINGEYKAQSALCVGGINGNSSAGFAIGNYPWANNNPFNGSIDEVAVWNRALSASEIANIYAKTATYHSNNQFTLSRASTSVLPVVTMSSDSNKFYTPLFSGKVSTPLTAVVGGDNEGPAISFVSPSPAEGSTTGATATLNVTTADATSKTYSMFNDELVAWYRLDNNATLENATKVYDWSGNNNNGTAINGAVANSSGKFAGAYSFDGSNQYITSTVANAPTGSQTVSMWAYFRNVTGTKGFYSRGGPNTAFALYPGAVLRIYAGNATTAAQAAIGTTTIGTNSWRHVAYTYNTTLWTLYLDGVQEATGSGITGTLSASTSVNLGYYNTGVPGVGYFNGSIDEVLIFNRSLSATEIQALYNSSQYALTRTTSGMNGAQNFTVKAVDSYGNMNTSSRAFTADTTAPVISIITPANNSNANGNVLVNASVSDASNNTYGFINKGLVAWYRLDNNATLENATRVYDHSGNNNNGTPTNGAVATSSGQFAGAYTFDGTDDVINLGTNKVYSQNANYSVSAWIKGSSQVTRVIYGEGNSAVDTQFLQLSTSATGTGIRFLVRNNSGQNIINDATTKVSLDDTWHHVTLTDNAGVYKIYIDGVQNASGTYTTYPVTLNKVTIGALGRTGYSEYFNGSIDEVLIFNRSLSATEIQALYNSSQYAIAGNVTTDYLTAGANTVTLNAVDSSGNLATSSVSVNYENSAPAVTFNLPVNGSVTGSTAVINFTSTDTSDHYALADIDNSLVGLWRMEQGNGTFFADTTGNNNGTCATTGCPTYNSTGRFGGAYGFDGTSDFIAVGAAGQRIIANGSNYTLSAWANGAGLNPNPAVVGVSNGGTVGKNGYAIDANSTTGVGCQIGNGTTVIGVTKVLRSGWNFYTCVLSGSNLSFYVNGVYNNSINVSLYLNGQYPVTVSDSRFIIGSAYVGNAGFWNGSIDDVTLFNRSLSSTEISSLYNATASQYQTSISGLADGTHNVRAYAVDAYGNMNNSELRTWSVDTVVPLITILSPVNGSNFNTTAVGFNISSSENLSYCGLSIDNAANVTMTLNASLTGANYTKTSLGEGNHNFTISCNDTTNNFNTSTLTFFLVDTLVPTLNVTSPVNGNYYNSQSVLSNVSSSEENTGSIVSNLDNSLVSWYRMDDLNSSGGVVDYMGVNNGTNINTTQTDNGKFGKGMSFNGVNSYVKVTQSNTLNFTAFTSSSWVNIENCGAGSPYQTIVSDTNNFAPLHGGWEIAVGANSCNFRLTWRNLSTGVVINYLDPYVAAKNRWYNIVGSFNGTVLNYYRDGVLISSSTAVSGVGGYVSDSSNFRIGGRYAATGDLFNGSIDDVQIYNRSLSSGEIVSLYNATKLQYTTSLADGSHTFKAYTQDAGGNVINSSLISFGVDTVYPAINFTGQTPASGTTQTGTSIAVNISSNDTNNHYVLNNFDNSLVGWWRMEQGNGTFFNDTIGLNNGTCTTTTCPAYNSSGAFGGAYNFDGNDDYINIINSVNMHPTSNITWGAWVYRPSGVPAGTQGVITTRSTTLDGYGIYASGNQFRCFVGNQTSFTTDVNGAFYVQLGTWSHIICVYNGTTLRTYANGVAGTPTAISFNSLANYKDNLTLLGRYFTDLSSNYYNGSIDEVVIFNRSLSSAEISSLYNASVNKYYNNFTDLAVGVHTMKGYAVDAAGNMNSTETRNVTIENPTQLTACGNLTLANTVYTLTQNITTTETCFNVAADGITIDGNGKSIIGVGGDVQGYGIVSIGRNNVTIKNFRNISGFDYVSDTGVYAGIYFNGTNNSLINNLSVAGNGMGIYIQFGSYNLLTDINVSSNMGTGIYIQSSLNNNVTNITANSDYLGIYLDNSNNTLLRNITGSYNADYILIMAGSNNNTISDIVTGYNYAAGILVYGSSSNNFTNIVTTSNSEDGIYLSASSNNILSNINTSSNGAWAGVYLTSSSNNNVLNNITANSNPYGIILSSSSNNIITNITANSNDNYGIYLYSSSNNNAITNVKANSNGENGVYLESCSNNTITGVTANSNDNYGISLSSGSNNNLMDITANSNNNGIILSSSSNSNNITNVTANSNLGSGVYFMGGSNNTLSSVTANSNTYDGIFVNGNWNNISAVNVSLNGKGINIYSDSSYNRISSVIANNNSNGLWLEGYNNVISSITANSNLNYGINIQGGGATNNNLSDIIANSNVNHGIFISIASYNNLTNVTANFNSDSGIYLLGGVNNIFSSVTSSSNVYGIYLYYAETSDNTFVNPSLWNNSAYQIYFNELANNALRYTNMNGTWEFTSPSFRQNMTINGTLSYPGTVTLGNNSAYFNASAVFGGNIAAMNSSANITLNGVPVFTGAMILKDGFRCTNCYNFTALSGDVIFNVSSAGEYSIGQSVNLISSCKILNEAGTYTVIRNVSTTGSCILVSADNVEINGAGYTLTGGSDPATYGINATNKVNVTIRDITMNNFGTGVEMANVVDGVVRDSSLINNKRFGVEVIGSDNTQLSNLVLDSNLKALNIDGSSGVNVTGGSISNSVQHAITLSTGADNFVINGTTMGTTNAQYYDLNVENDVNGTKLINAPSFVNYSIGRGTLSLINDTYGKVVFTNVISGTGNLSRDIDIGLNSLNINSSKIGLNATANVTLYNVPAGFVDTRILRNGVACSDCVNSTALNGTVVFTVPGYGLYTIGSGDTTAPQIMYTIGTLNNKDYAGTAATGQSTQLFVNVSINETNLANVTYYLFNRTGGVIQNMTFTPISGSTAYNYTFSIAANGTYMYTVNATDILNNKNGTTPRNVTVWPSCIGSTPSCSEDQVCIISANCTLHNDLCGDDKICTFTNLTFTSSNKYIHTLYDGAGNGRNLTLNISGRNSFALGSGIIFSGRSGLVGGDVGSRGGNAGFVNWTSYNLFNTTYATFTGIGGYSTDNVSAGGNGGRLELNYHGLIRNFTDNALACGEFDEDLGDYPRCPSNVPVLTAGSSIGSAGSGMIGAITYTKSLACLPIRDRDVAEDGLINTNDIQAIVTDYSTTSADVGFNQSHDITCNDKINVAEIARIGLEFNRR